MNLKMTIIADSIFGVSNGGCVRREFGQTPNGSPMNGQWVYRDSCGRYIDHDRYREELAQRNKLQT